MQQEPTNRAESAAINEARSLAAATSQLQYAASKVEKQNERLRALLERQQALAERLRAALGAEDQSARRPIEQKSSRK